MASNPPLESSSYENSVEQRTLDAGTFHRYASSKFSNLTWQNMVRKGLRLPDRQGNGTEERYADSEPALRRFPSYRPPSLRVLKLSIPSSWIIHPRNRYYWYWTNYMTVGVLYTSFFGVFEFAFLPKPPLWLISLNLAVDGHFFVDMVVTFFVAYFHRETDVLITSHRRIAARYLRSTFVLDFCSTIPFGYIFALITGDSTRQTPFRLLSLMRLWRLWRLNQVFSRLEKNVRLDYFWTRITRFLVVVLLVVHFFGCFFYYLAVSYEERDAAETWLGDEDPTFRTHSLFRRYITSVYFSMVALTTVGFGDYAARSNWEKVFVIFYLLLGLGINAYVIGNITAMIQMSSRRTLEYRQKISDVKTYMIRNNLPRPLRRQMLEHVKLKARISEKRNEILNEFAKPIKAQVAHTLHRRHLESTLILKGCSQHFLDQLEADLEVEYYLPGDVVMAQLDVNPQLYIVTLGSLEAVRAEEPGGTPKTPKGQYSWHTSETFAHSRRMKQMVLMEIRVGMTFGEAALLCDIPQPFTVRAKTFTRLLTIKREKWADIIDSFPQDALQMANNLCKKVQASDNPVLAQLGEETARVIRKKAEALNLQLLDAATTGDLMKLQRLLEAEADPNHTDYDGRSALHVSACQGFDDCVRSLVEAGAEINLEDERGSTPLSYALRMGHESTAGILREFGAEANPRTLAFDLCVAVTRQHRNQVHLLLDYGADPNCQDHDGKSPLHLACVLDNMAIIGLLLERGADLGARDSSGQSVRDEAKNRAHEWVIGLFEAEEERRKGTGKAKDRDG